LRLRLKENFDRFKILFFKFTRRIRMADFKRYALAFAGLVPDQIGLYQVKLTIPVATPPGIDLPVLLRQAGSDSNTAFVAVQ